MLCKSLCVGDSGARKTASLAALALAGWKLRIVDLDDGLQILWSILEDHCSFAEQNGFFRAWRKGQDPKESPLIEAKTFRNSYSVQQFVTSGNKMQRRLIADSPASAFLSAIEQIDKWSDLDASHILVIDSASFLNRLAEENIRSLNGTLTRERISLPEIGVAREDIERVLCGLFSPGTSCHVIIMAHIKYVEVKENQITSIPVPLGTDNRRGPENSSFNVQENPSIPYPNFIGKLPQSVGMYFNCVLGYRVMGQSAEIVTKPFNGLGVKAPSIKVKPCYSLPDHVSATSGLAAFFSDVGAHGLEKAS